jgi:hypothetical protein
MQEIAVGGAKRCRALMGAAAAVLAMVLAPLPPMVCSPVLEGRFVRPMRWTAAASAHRSRIGRLIGQVAASGSVADGDLRHSMVAFGGGGKFGIMRCRAGRWAPAVCADPAPTRRRV